MSIFSIISTMACENMARIQEYMRYLVPIDNTLKKNNKNLLKSRIMKIMIYRTICTVLITWISKQKRFWKEFTHATLNINIVSIFYILNQFQRFLQKFFHHIKKRLNFSQDIIIKYLRFKIILNLRAILFFFEYIIFFDFTIKQQ